jgi:hypothetical protein
MARRRPLVVVAAVLAGAGWWSAVFRLALDPVHPAVEDAVVMGGWTLSLLPVHAVAREASATLRLRRGPWGAGPAEATRRSQGHGEDGGA